MKDEKRFEVAIIGGGFSALVLANNLKLSKDAGKVAVFEKLDRVGKKILSTGNGRGNVTNKMIDISGYHGNDPKFARYAIERYDSLSLRSFFSDLGLLFVTEENRVYPASMQANSLLDALRFGLSKLNAQIFLSSCVTKISFDDNSQEFLLCANGENFRAKNVVCAFGGSSQKQFGTGGTSFGLAKMLGHHVTKLQPSLVQMRSNSPIIKGLKGVKAEVRLSLFSNGEKIKTTIGDLLFTDSGISGNAVFFLSSYLADLKSPFVVVEFIPEISENRLIDHLFYKKQCFEELEASEFLGGIVHKQIGKNIIKTVTRAQTIGQISDGEIRKIAHKVKNFEIEISGTLGFDYSQVTHGGVETSEVDDRTFESKIQRGLYFVGEALDIDGDCGGFNLQWAFSSAMCVAEAINGKTK